MGLTVTNLKFILKKSKRYGFIGPVLTLGNQDIYATEKDIRKWAEKFNIKLRDPKKILYSTSGDVPKINKEAAKYIHARTFFEFLGIKEEDYFDIDKFDFDKPKIIHDLQFPIESEFHNFFNFIVDSGTLEHIFDARAVMENIARMTKIGGYVLQIIPAQNFLNHGFYQFSPTFFYDFYINNGFEIMESYLIEIRGGSDRYYKYNQGVDYTGLFFNPKRRLVNCFLVRKKHNPEKIVLPDQFFYEKLANSEVIFGEDFNRSVLDKAANFIRGIVPIRYHGMFFSFWQVLKRRTAKRSYFDLKK